MKRPDQSIVVTAPDDNYGLFFVPAAPTLAEVAGITWKTHVDEQSGETFEFGVIIRGSIEIRDVSIDCNMGQQLLETLGKNKTAEHSAMLGFAGQEYLFTMDGGVKQPIPRSPSGLKRVVYVGFQSVKLKNVTTLNGGYADDIWVSRGYFNPNIELVVVEGLRSGPRVSPKRATLSISGLCQNIQVRDADIDELHMEDTIKQNYDELPRQASVFTPATLRLSKIKAKHIGLAAKGKVYKLAAKDLTATESFTLYQAGGVIKNSTLRVKNERRLIRLNDFVFDQVTWQLEPDETGKVRGLKPTSAEGDLCGVTFKRNVFSVTGMSVSGEIIASEYSPEPTQNDQIPNSVKVAFLGCTYPSDFGRSVEKPIARVKERGVWTFAVKDLGDRDRDVAIDKGPKPDIELKWV